MMLYKLKLAACFGIPETSGTCIISLVDESEKRALSIMTNVIRKLLILKMM